MPRLKHTYALSNFLQPDIFEISLMEIWTLRHYASFGTFCVQIGQRLVNFEIGNKFLQKIAKCCNFYNTNFYRLTIVPFEKYIFGPNKGIIMWAARSNRDVWKTFPASTAGCYKSAQYMLCMLNPGRFFNCIPAVLHCTVQCSSSLLRARRISDLY